MKKLIIGSFAILMLAGCGGKSEPKKTCTLENNGMKQSMTYYGKNSEKVKKMEMKMTVPNETLGEEFVKASKEDKAKQAKMMADGMAGEGTKGVKADAKVDDKTVTLSVTADVSKMDAEMKTTMGLDLKVSEAIKTATDSGATCK